VFDQALSFTPLYQERVWGGRLLQTVLGRELPHPELPYGESWELVDRPEAISIIPPGSPLAGLSLHDLWRHHRAEVFGPALSQHPSPRFPLLMKILDAREDLSIQVHPPASMAEQLNGEPKTEMWFIAHAEPDAKIYAGLKPGTSRDSFQQALSNGSVADQIHVITPQTGDCLFIPSGRVHAIGAGLLIYEIQQNSDTTYRVFDWNRLGLDGQPRPLHVEESLASIDFDDFAPTLQTPVSNGLLVNCPYFTVHLRSITADASAPLPTLGQPGESLTFAVTRGLLTIGQTTFHAGDFALLPATLTSAQRQPIAASPDAQWLEIHVPSDSVKP